MVSLQASKILFSLAIASLAPSPAPRMSNIELPSQREIYSSYKSTLVLDSMTHQAKTCVNLKSSPFLVNLDAGFFSVATDIKHGFLSFGTFSVATWHSIPELH